MRKTRSRRRSSRRKQVAARWRFVTGFTLFALAVVAAMLLTSRQSGQTPVSDADLPQASVTPDLPTLPVAALLDRPVYPYSIVEGGARSADELKQAIAKDPVVAAHYADFDLENTQVVRLEQPKLAHVSYRMGNAVYWTRKPLVIGAGETVLTDGVHIARARCANQLADMPGETSPVEPAQAVLDTPLPQAAAPLQAMSPVDMRLSPAGGIVGPIGGSLSAGLLAGGGGLPSGGSPTAAGAATGIEAERSANPGPPDDPGDPGGFPGIPSHFPVPTGSMPPFDGPPNTPDTPKWPVPPETLLPPGSPDLPPDLFDPGDPGLPETPNVPEVVPVPEPGTALLMLGGAAAYVARRLKKKVPGSSA
jgi:PEP-CTERM motif-containing protein